jgi:hypothetical protein
MESKITPMPVGGLQELADACFRLRARYLWAKDGAGLEEVEKLVAPAKLWAAWKNPYTKEREALALTLDPYALELSAYPWPLNAASGILQSYQVAVPEFDTLADAPGRILVEVPTDVVAAARASVERLTKRYEALRHYHEAELVARARKVLFSEPNDLAVVTTHPAGRALVGIIAAYGAEEGAVGIAARVLRRFTVEPREIFAEVARTLGSFDSGFWQYSIMPQPLGSDGSPLPAVFTDLESALALLATVVETPGNAPAANSAPHDDLSYRVVKRFVGAWLPIDHKA